MQFSLKNVLTTSNFHLVANPNIVRLKSSRISCIVCTLHKKVKLVILSDNVKINFKDFKIHIAFAHQVQIVNPTSHLSEIFWAMHEYPYTYFTLANIENKFGKYRFLIQY